MPGQARNPRAILGNSKKINFQNLTFSTPQKTHHPKHHNSPSKHHNFTTKNHHQNTRFRKNPLQKHRLPPGKISPKNSLRRTRQMRKSPLQPLPLFTRKQPRTRFDKPRHHIKDRHAVPRSPVAHPKTLLIQITHYRRIRKILADHLHHQNQDLVLRRLDLQPLAVIRDTQPIRNILMKCSLRRSIGVGSLTPPLDRYQLPPA